jgi:hypothetical protein
MVILISKDQMNSIYLNLLKFGTTEKEGIPALDYKNIEEFGNRK